MSGCTKAVFVGLSGGVDSSVAALRLKKQGFNVVGVFIRVWQPEFLECNWEAERLDAMRVAAHLNIPFLTCDARDAYKKGVGEYFISEYKEGRTPNPDVLCNQKVKFGAFLQFAKEHKADFVATGHYAQNKALEGSFSLQRGIDTSKDQSYFLYTLTQEQLAYILFPVGDSPKKVIREEAEKAGIPVATKKDSQGVCFLGFVDIPEFMSHFIDLKPGTVLNEQGESIGEHGGAEVYTLGQRHGFKINNNDIVTLPHYVTDKNISNNTITVSTKPSLLLKESVIQITEVNWITQSEENVSISAQFRYRQKPFAVKLRNITLHSCTIELEDNEEVPAPGQSCVFYDGDICLGGGIII